MKNVKFFIPILLWMLCEYASGAPLSISNAIVGDVTIVLDKDHIVSGDSEWKNEVTRALADSSTFGQNLFSSALLQWRNADSRYAGKFPEAQVGFKFFLPEVDHDRPYLGYLGITISANEEDKRGFVSGANFNAKGSSEKYGFVGPRLSNT